jgi:hypothetical protein
MWLGYAALFTRLGVVSLFAADSDIYLYREYAHARRAEAESGKHHAPPLF